jgi:hypothetical protein
MRFWQALRKETVLRNDRALLYAIARNLIIDWYRKKKEASLDALSEEGFEAKGTDEVPILHNAMNEEVLAVINTLDEPSLNGVVDYKKSVKLRLKAGKHVVKVSARDRAGNSSARNLAFSLP